VVKSRTYDIHSLQKGPGLERLTVCRDEIDSGAVAFALPFERACHDRQNRYVDP
jgi:hypothetical protein